MNERLACFRASSNQTNWPMVSEAIGTRAVGSVRSCMSSHIPHLDAAAKLHTRRIGRRLPAHELVACLPPHRFTGPGAVAQLLH
jgi:hypothetical protein